METRTVLLIVGGIAVWYLARKYQQRQDDRRNVQFDLRYPTLDDYHPKGDTFFGNTFVDFEQMVLVGETSDVSYHHTRVYHLRRLDGPVWQIREEDTSRERSRAHLSAWQTVGGPFSEDRRKQEQAALDNLDWVPCGWADDIEPKYQLFLRHRDPTAAAFRGGLVERAVASDFVEGSPRPSQRSAGKT